MKLLIAYSFIILTINMPAANAFYINLTYRGKQYNGYADINKDHIQFTFPDKGNFLEGLRVVNAIPIITNIPEPTKEEKKGHGRTKSYGGSRQSLIKKEIKLKNDNKESQNQIPGSKSSSFSEFPLTENEKTKANNKETKRKSFFKKEQLITISQTELAHPQERVPRNLGERRQLRKSQCCSYIRKGFGVIKKDEKDGMIISVSYEDMEILNIFQRGLGHYFKFITKCGRDVVEFTTLNIFNPAQTTGMENIFGGKENIQYGYINTIQFVEIYAYCFEETFTDLVIFDILKGLDYLVIYLPTEANLTSICKRLKEKTMCASEPYNYSGRNYQREIFYLDKQSVLEIVLLNTASVSFNFNFADRVNAKPLTLTIDNAIYKYLKDIIKGLLRLKEIDQSYGALQIKEN
jgi:hypothetical protein